MQKNRIVLVFGALLGAGALTLGGVYWWRARSKTGSLATAASYSSPSECLASCNADPACTAYSVSVDGNCTTSHGDPLTEWGLDPDSDLHVKKKEGEPAYSWSAWSSPCSATCGGGTVSRTCSTANKCPGPKTQACNTQTCDTIQTMPSKVMPYPAQKMTIYDNVASADCNKKCFADPTCSGFHVGVSGTGTGFACRMYNSPFTAITLDTTAYAGQQGMLERIPAGSGKWGSWPALTCGGGVTQIKRPCASGTCVGASYYQCPLAPKGQIKKLESTRSIKMAAMTP